MPYLAVAFLRSFTSADKSSFSDSDCLCRFTSENGGVGRPELLDATARLTGEFKFAPASACLEEA